MSRNNNAEFVIPEMRSIRNIHMIGIAGSGMSGIAEVLFNLGYLVTGSDVAESAVTERLEKIGIKVFSKHHPNNIGNADVVVCSSAIENDNPELIESHTLRIPVIPRAEMLAELMRYRHGIAVAGTHGKTTTTSLIASILNAAELDPTFVVGGRLNAAGSNARLGAGRFLVAEADESDASFLHLQPMVSVVTNLESEHLSTYDGNFENLCKTFLEFLHNLPFYGLAVLNSDDKILASMIPKLSRRNLTFGFAEDADYRIENFERKGLFSQFNISRPNKKNSLSITLGMPGKHNVLNAAAAIAVASEEGIEDSFIQAGLENFLGVDRRFSQRGELILSSGSAYLVDDYGHHPTEILATLDSVRQVWPTHRLVMIYQPHRFTRTRDLYEEFVRVLSQCDVLILLEVYAAGESPIVGADSRSLSRSIRLRRNIEPIFVDDIDHIPAILAGVLVDGDIVVTQGAGSISSIAHKLSKLNISEL